MPSPERAFTQHLLHECEVKDHTILSLVRMVQLQYSIAQLHGHPFQIPPLEGDVPLEMVDAMLQSLRRQEAELQKHSNGAVHVVGKPSEPSAILENANASNESGYAEES